ncbi:hypothetical protein BABINDRAFT_160542 [Babjeviella inositovora NRRL Y-12698]|uniref:Enhancer of translation termination 1 n=1 Tax=Babjeviella inositovora NRRL Y-12698 TaxID=984486 RepID=A0A1E3QTX7_9ASCO|nr:uncharacterized protein BABINDRAFT_160542 [Babjeviella inositovora NRRL Y-12698]ODQ81141.1 hypothetical protein BABINDRAFT_160542 [Babjeviella inositovora NRRL Y-12698]
MTRFLEVEKEIDEFFTTAEERIETGLEQYPQSISLLFAQAKLLLNRIPLGYVSRMDLESTTKEFPKVATLLDRALDVYESAEMQAEIAKDFSCFTQENFEILETYDDLLDFIDNFGRNTADGLDSDEESGDEEEVELSKKHPLRGIKEEDKYNLWWREHVVTFLTHFDAKKSKEVSDVALRREICKRLGQSYLMEAEEPSQIFTALTYENSDEYPDLDVKEVQKDVIKLVEQAIAYLKQAEDPEVPQSWVDIAEAQITLANLHDNESEIQEATYKLAEERLAKANKATHGKYDDIMKNLLAGDSDEE